MQDVSDNGHLLSRYTSQPLADGVGVKQRLGWVLMCTVAGVDNIGVDMPGEVVRSSRTCVAYDDHVNFHGQDVIDGVEQCFAFLDRAVGRRKIDNVSRQALLSQLEGKPCPRRVLKKDVGYGDVA